MEVKNFLEAVLKNMPSDWLRLTTHRLDIYNESKAKTEFITQFNACYNKQDYTPSTLSELPTAYDYIRLGHPLSSVLEWAIAKSTGLSPEQVISFSSATMPILAVLRKNAFINKKTHIIYTDALPEHFDAKAIRTIYGYSFELHQLQAGETPPQFDGSIIFVSQADTFNEFKHEPYEFHVNIHSSLGSVIMINSLQKEEYTSEIQHVRRRESIAMTPANCHTALHEFIGTESPQQAYDEQADEQTVLNTIREVTGTAGSPIVGSSGLSIQYCIMMGLIDYANEHYPGKAIKIIVPPNCYGGTNDQARRVAACLDHVSIMDLPVDGDNDMVSSTDAVLEEVARLDAVPFIIAEIPTNPRVEVPNLESLKAALIKTRHTSTGDEAIPPVFILDQTFCPNVQFLGEGKVLSAVKTIAYVSGSKFPSGGKCTAGYCVTNQKASDLMPKMAKHLHLCDNGATDLQFHFLAEQLPSMNERIQAAYLNTREFVDFIQVELPAAKINFVSHELAEQGFTPSVFSLDLPTKGTTDEEREAYKRELNHKLINMMIESIPSESKYCVSYGQLKGCYWTIPATSTQGTTKEGDKDYIARVAVSPNLDLARHKAVFLNFVGQL